MTFLNPAYLFGLFAAAVPVIIHFLNLRKLKTVEFSTLKFLKEIQRTKIRNLKIKQWLLLLLRVLIIIFLVLAFSRPTLKEINLPLNNNVSKVSAVFIIDNSISMSVKDAKGNSLAEAKNIARKLLNNFNSGDEIAVLSTSLEDKNNIKFSKDFQTADNKITQLEISDISNDISLSLKRSLELLSLSANANKEIFILSDFQKSKFFKEHLNKKNIENKEVKIYLIPVNKPIINNITAKNLTLENQIFEKNKTISFSSEIRNGENLFANGVLSLFVNRERIAQSSFNLLPREHRKVFFENTINKHGLIECRIDADDDNLTSDNSRFISFYVPEKISVLFVSNNPESAKYLELVVNYSGQDIILNKTSFSQIASYDLSSVDLIILAGDYGNNLNGLIKLLPNNKSLMIFPSTKLDEKEFSMVLSAFNLGKAKLIVSDSYNEFDKADWTHPILTGLFEDKKIKNIDSPQIKKYFRIKSEKSFKTIISLQDDFPFLFESKKNRQKIFVFSVPPDLSGSDFPVKGIFAPLMLKSINYLSAFVNTENNYTAGSAVSFAQPRIVPSLKVIKPNGEEEYIKLSKDEKIIFKNTNLTGCYKFFDKDKLIYFADVNIEPKETDYDFYSVDEAKDKLESEKIQAKIITIKDKSKIDERVTIARLGTELWIYFLMIVLLLVIAEMIISRNTKNDTARITIND